MDKALAFILGAPIVFAQPLVFAADPVEQLYVASYSTSLGLNKTHTKTAYLLLLPDGTAFGDLPDGVITGVTAEELLQQSKKKSGTYVREGNKLEIHWPNRSKRKNHWTLDAEGSGWRHEELVYLPVRPPDPEWLKGLWQQSGGTTGSLLGLPVSIGGDEYAFRTKGRFKYDGRKDGTGTFEVDGYTLILRFKDGSIERKGIFIWPHSPYTIRIDGEAFQQLN